MLGQLFFHKPDTSEVPDVPRVELPDPSEGKALADSYRAARRNLSIASGVALAWSTAQFGNGPPKLSIFGVTVDLSNGSIPTLLAGLMLYSTWRWGMEFAMQPRCVRRWRLAQVDFGFTSWMVRLTLATLAAGALHTSAWNILIILTALVVLAVSALLLGVVLMIPMMFIRMAARARANSPSAANAAFEAYAWASIFALFLSCSAALAFFLYAYENPSMTSWLWAQPPSPWAFAGLVFVILATFLSPLFVGRLKDALFSSPPGYYTERDDDGTQVITTVPPDKTPLL